jgi:hypothetical protein
MMPVQIFNGDYATPSFVVSFCGGHCLVAVFAVLVLPLASFVLSIFLYQLCSTHPLLLPGAKYTTATGDQYFQFRQIMLMMDVLKRVDRKLRAHLEFRMAELRASLARHDYSGQGDCRNALSCYFLLMLLHTGL